MIGESIGNYRITARLGRGGMGEVYVAEHDGIKTHVAIKMLLPEVSRSEEHVTRFFNEAIIVGRIKHAGIVKIFDSGFFDGHAYLMMELLEGETLAARIARGTLAPAEVVEVARQIASILDATHRAGVIHRDLKPDNIFLVTDHELPHGERVKILDFGISKLSGTLAGGSPRTQGTMGTPQYMAPEQWGDSATVDWRADAYSLGCVCYEMLTGQPPFDARNIAEAYTKHLNAPPPPLTTYVSEVPAPLDALVLRLLAKRAADRAPSMAMVVSELDELARTIDPDAKPTVPRHARLATGPTEAQNAGTDPTVRLGKPPPTTTTLGAAASQLEVTAPRNRRGLAAVIGGIAVVATAAVIVVAATRGSSSNEAPIVRPAPVAQPIATSPPPPPPPPPPTPEPAPVVTAPPTPTPAVATPTPPPPRTSPKHHVATHPVAPTPTLTPTPTPTLTPTAGSGDPWGGRR
ncbi:MAG TPA: serine/threonine-protein kinase [Kofleriaceae bacterium]